MTHKNLYKNYVETAAATYPPNCEEGNLFDGQKPAFLAAKSSVCLLTVFRGRLLVTPAVIMDFVVYIFGFIILAASSSASHDATVDYDYTPEDIRETKASPRFTQRTEAPLARYEVTELIDDVPNPNPPPLLKATNFTLNRPLNIVNATNNVKQNVANRDNPKFIKDFSNIPIEVDTAFEGPNTPVEVPNTNKSPAQSEFEAEDVEDIEHHHEDFHHYPDVLPIIKTYLDGLEKGIKNGLNGIVGNVLRRVNEPIRATTPVWFLNKLKHRKGHMHDDYNDRNEHTHFDYELDDY